MLTDGSGTDNREIKLDLSGKLFLFTVQQTYVLIHLYRKLFKYIGLEKILFM